MAFSPPVCHFLFGGENVGLNLISLWVGSRLIMRFNPSINKCWTGNGLAFTPFPTLIVDHSGCILLSCMNGEVQVDLLTVHNSPSCPAFMGRWVTRQYYNPSSNRQLNAGWIERLGPNLTVYRPGLWEPNRSSTNRWIRNCWCSRAGTVWDLICGQLDHFGLNLYIFPTTAHFQNNWKYYELWISRPFPYMWAERWERLYTSLRILSTVASWMANVVSFGQRESRKCQVTGGDLFLCSIRMEQERTRCKLWCASRKGASIPTAFRV